MDREIWHPKFELVQKLIHVLYNLEGCGCGGCCHIVADDDNIYDEDLDWVIKHCESEESKENVDRELSATICKILKDMTFTQRAILFEITNSDYDLENCTESDVEFALKHICKMSVNEVIESYDYDRRFNE